MSPASFRRVAVSSILLLMAPAAVTGQADATPLWRYSATGGIGSLVLARQDSVLYVATGTGMVALDAVTGTPRWERRDLAEIPAPSFGYLESLDSDSRHALVLTRDKRLTIIDLGNGASLAGSGSWSVEEIRGFTGFQNDPLALVVAKAGKNSRIVLGIDPRTAEVRWRQEGLFERNVEFNKAVGFTRGSAVSTLWGNQRPFKDSDSTGIAYLSKDGPIRLLLATGQILWRAQALQGKGVPKLWDGYAAMIQSDSLLFVPVDTTLYAIKVNDGSVAWQAAWFPARAARMALTPAGLLIAGGTPDQYGRLSARYLGLLDPATGKARWAGGSLSIDYDTPVVLRGDTAWVMVGRALTAVPLSDGKATVVHRLSDDVPVPFAIELHDSGFVIHAGRGLMLLDHGGHTVYYQAFHRRGVGLFGVLGAAMLGIVPDRGAAGRGARDHVYYVDWSPDDSGTSRVSLVQVDKSSGALGPRLWLPKEPRRIVVRESSGTVYLELDGEILAFRLP